MLRFGLGLGLLLQSSALMGRVGSSFKAAEVTMFLSGVGRHYYMEIHSQQSQAMCLFLKMCHFFVPLCIVYGVIGASVNGGKGEAKGDGLVLMFPLMFCCQIDFTVFPNC